MATAPTSGPGGGDSGSVLTLSAHIPSAILLTLNNVTDYELLPAPGAGKVIYPLHYFALVTGTTAYTTAGSALIVVGSAHNGPLLSGIADVLTASPLTWLTSPYGTNNGTLADAENLALYLASSDALTVGDLDLDLTIYYVLVDLP